MRITQEKLKEILASHSKWLRGENGGEKADLSNVDLSYINLNHTDLRGANFCGANLYRANLFGANLSGAKLCGADLCGADLSYSSLRATNLRHTNLSNSRFGNANLSTTSLSKTYYQIVRIGSREATTTYCVEDDNVRCGCWNNYGGGTLEEFKKRVESVYGENGARPNKKYYTQYMAAIEFFEKMAKLARMEEEQ
jgi:hypothetical protein|nr:MAG TPA: pentapeptide repeat protein [Caudoviricetes sp.]